MTNRNCVHVSHLCLSFVKMCHAVYPQVVRESFLMALLKQNIKAAPKTTDVWFYIWGPTQETKANKHVKATTEGLCDNPQSRSFIKTSPMHAKLRGPQVSLLASGHSLFRQKTYDIALSERLILIIKYPGPFVSKFPEDAFRWCWFILHHCHPSWKNRLSMWQFPHWTLLHLFLFHTSRTSFFYVPRAYFLTLKDSYTKILMALQWVASLGWVKNNCLFISVSSPCISVTSMAFQFLPIRSIVLNNIHPKLSGTHERERDNGLAFLDIVMTWCPDRKIQKIVYRKATWIGQYIRFSSFVPVTHRPGIAKTLFYRVRNICSTDQVQK